MSNPDFGCKTVKKGALHHVLRTITMLRGDIVSIIVSPVDPDSREVWFYVEGGQYAVELEMIRIDANMKGEPSS
jgi:hypothetical protein